MNSSSSQDDRQWPLSIGVDIGGTQMRAAVLQGSALISRVGLLTGTESAPGQSALPAPQVLNTQPLVSSLAAGTQGEQDEALLVNAHAVARAAEAGIPLARAIIAGAGEALGVGLVNILHIFNSDRVILGGGVTQMGDMLLEPARLVVRERTMQAPRQSAQIVLAEFGPNAGLIGAGALGRYSGG